MPCRLRSGASADLVGAMALSLRLRAPLTPPDTPAARRSCRFVSSSLFLPSPLPGLLSSPLYHPHPPRFYSLSSLPPASHHVMHPHPLPRRSVRFLARFVASLPVLSLSIVLDLAVPLFSPLRARGGAAGSLVATVGVPARRRRCGSVALHSRPAALERPTLLDISGVRVRVATSCPFRSHLFPARQLVFR